ncbi:MAG: bacillithiol biosynthesis deacetylase BshB1 [Saprospiraceae bacterium]|jgi:bacillithiol biosynthesis deacetylase BshB1
MIEIYKKLQTVDILAFGIHPDDIELSASGTLLSHIEKGYKVGLCDLSEGELGTLGNAETRKEESLNAAEILGVDFRVNLSMRDGFSQIDESHILRIAEVIRCSRPKIILANALEDRHPDHSRGARLVKEAFFFSGLRKITKIQGEAFRADVLYHYIQDKQLKPDLCVGMAPFIDQKWESIKAYKTQFFRSAEEDVETPISSLTFMKHVESSMRIFGRNIGEEFAEGFNVHRPIGVDNLLDLK